MFLVKVRSVFSGAHNLRGYKGKCEDLHGHNWKVEVSVSGEKLDDIGMVVDFSLLKQELNKILNELDHKYLNKIEYFKCINPTSENIAKYVYEKMVKNGLGVNIKEITVWETDTSSATYSVRVVGR
ncbi:MAG: 6-carboxytetrahydropterin synthase QueD [Candidatus Omnitrophota bacterium]